MAYGNKMKKSNSNRSTGKNNSVSNAAKGAKTPYKGFVGERQAYKITGKVLGQK